MKTAEIKKFLKKNKTPLLIAAGVIVVIVVIWIIVRNRNKGNAYYNDNPETITGTSVTPGTDFRDLAKRMLHAFIDKFGTDEDAVYAVLGQLKSQADWVKLKREYEKVWSDESWLEQGIHIVISMKSGNLVADMKDELSSKELARCRSILEENGITPDF